MKLSKSANDGGSVMDTRRWKAVILREFLMGSSVIPRVIFGNPSPAQFYRQSRMWPRSRFKIPNPELQIREIPYPEKPVFSVTACLNLAGVKNFFFYS